MRLEEAVAAGSSGYRAYLLQQPKLIPTIPRRHELAAGNSKDNYS